MYVGEAKFWKGQGKVEEHLNQTFGYAPSHICQAIFLYYVDEKNVDLIRERGTVAIQRYSTNFRHWEDDIAVLQHPKFNHEIQLTVLYAHFPTPSTPLRQI